MRNFDHLRSKVTELEKRCPQTYVLLDGAGEEVLRSDLEPLDWYQDVVTLLNDPRRADEAEKLREQLQRAVRSKSGDLLFQVARVLLAGPMKTSAS